MKFDNSTVSVISTGPHSFAGAGTVHARILGLFCDKGICCSFVATGQPHASSFLQSKCVDVNIPRIRSDAYPHSDALLATAVTERICDQAKTAAAQNQRVVLLASFLWPFCQVAVSAAEILSRDMKVSVVLIPAGSDIWQIGKQVPIHTRSLLQSRYATVIVAYSDRFRQELIDYGAPIERTLVIPPPLDTHTFEPASPEARYRLRMSLEIPPDAFVMLHCSNMRPVKGVEHVIRLAVNAATRISKASFLVLVGPVTEHLKLALRANGFVDNSSGRLQKQNLQIISVGLQIDVVRFHQISDVALNSSFHDSFNVSLLESMACGVPVVSSEEVGLATTISNFRCGCLFSIPAEQVRSFLEGHDSVEATFEANNAIAFCVRLAWDHSFRTEIGLRAREAAVAIAGEHNVWGLWSSALCFEGSPKASTRDLVNAC